MKKSLVTFVLGILIGALFFGGTSVLAETGIRSIDAEFSDIKIVVDGKLISSPVEPFMFNDKVFVPLRVVGEALGQKVNWEDNTVLVGKEKQSLLLADVVTPLATNGRCSANGNMSVNNQNYEKGFYVLNKQSWVERGNTGGAKTDFFLENKGIKEVNGSIGIDDSNTKLYDSVYVSITADGKTIWDGKIKKGEQLQDIAINAEGIKTLSFYIGAPENSKVDFIDFKVKY